MSAQLEALARAVFAAYSSNSGSPPDLHRDRNAAEQWMAQALVECGVAELIEAARDVNAMRVQSEAHFKLRAALSRIGATK